MSKRIIFTGGSGKAGRHVVRDLVHRGYKVLNLDLTRLDEPDVHTMKCDMTDAGQVYSALHTSLSLAEPLEPASPPDAIIHFAGIPQPILAPDNEVFRSNVMGFHNVVEAACKLGVKKIILASSVTIYGVTYAEGDREFTSFPIDEDIDCNPTDPYALSKLVGEKIARSFAARFGVDIYCLRLGRVFTPDGYEELFPSYVQEPERWAVHGWSYIDARDLGQVCHLCLQKDGLGFQVFNTTNNSITNMHNTTEFLKERYPNVPFTRELGETEAPLSNRKLRDMLGFVEEHPWQKHFSPSK